MDIVEILRLAISRLPDGDHLHGLKAVVRHIDSAVAHYERGSSNSQADAFTDVVYRTNQAFEGSLKEGYRVLAGKDPKNKRLHEIEEYFEKANAFRERVLEQFTRYRQDYRNRSTHEYALDFDSDEALLAILSVCAFAKMLVDQISEKIAFETSRQASTSAGSVTVRPIASDMSSIRQIANELVEFMSGDRGATAVGLESEFEGTIAGFLSAKGRRVDLTPQSPAGSFQWDLAISTDKGSVLLEISSPSGTSSRITFAADALTDEAKRTHAAGLILVFRQRQLPEGKSLRLIEYEAQSFKDTDNFETILIVPKDSGISYGSPL